MNIVVCYKCVRDDQDIQVKANSELDVSQAGWKVGPYDLNAVEAGMRLFEKEGGSISVLTAAGEVVSDSKMKKAILSRGPEQMYAVQSDALTDADSFESARVLASAIRRIGDVNLVLCGEGSGDVYAQQVGSLVGNMLGWNTVNAVSSIVSEGDSLIVERSLESCIEVLSVPLPAVISVTSDINAPRIGGMKDILEAGKKPSTIWNLDELGEAVQNTVETVSLVAPEQADRKHYIVEGDGDEAIEEFVGFLRKAM